MDLNDISQESSAPRIPTRLLIAIGYNKRPLVLALEDDNDGGEWLDEFVSEYPEDIEELFENKECLKLAPGFWVWKGFSENRWVMVGNDCCDCGVYLVGDFRAATSSELYHFHQHGKLRKEFDV